MPSFVARRCIGAVILSTVLGLAACGGGSGGTDPAEPARPVAQSNLEIAQLLYSDSARTPPGFYSEPAPPSGYFRTSHIKNADLAPADAGAGPVFELCSDDWNEALGWSESVAASEPSATDLTATDETEQYFQFVRTPRAAGDATQQMRVYRCAFLDRNGADIARLTGAAGHINKRPLNETDVRWTLEYLWRFSLYNNAGSVVLKSAAAAGDSNPAHELILAALDRTAGAGGCDRVRVFTWSLHTDMASGGLTSEQHLLWTFDAADDAGTARLCTT